MTIKNKLNAEKLPWSPPKLPEGCGIPTGDMPGDKVLICPEHIAKANAVFSELLNLLFPTLENSCCGRVVVSICGGSGVGKSEAASLISYYLNEIGVGAYTLSGDNYPYRIPKYNDAERLRIFRKSGMQGLIAFGQYTGERGEVLCRLQRENQDADKAKICEHPWLNIYQQQGDCGLKGYLGTQNEIDFHELSSIVARFHNGENFIFLKRMGQEAADIWYEQIDFSNIQVLVIEWTHGNNDNLLGVDIPVFLYSTPSETLAHRLARGRDKGADSPFTGRVLDIEAGLLQSQAYKAKLIVSKGGRIMTYNEFQAAYSSTGV